MTPLMIAIDKRHKKVARELIERGADINLKTNGKRRRDKEIQH